ncbi:hypothetical protein [Sphingomonas sp. Root710]|uniref:hypothetical protein n=1 Tax=Sphingomonas sp. Root710 TaxID=1736594 RepID=UPI00138F05C1|nr:hypothetical protein [Sphingomonas sp. Root710]
MADLDAGGVDNGVQNAPCFECPMKPEAIIARLIARADFDICKAALLSHAWSHAQVAAQDAIMEATEA